MEINLYGAIDATTAEYFSQNLRGQQQVVVHINSPGGNVFSALTINSLLQSLNATAIIEGLCASAATLVALGAKKIIMAQNALMMIHSPSTLLVDMVTKDKLEQMATTMEKVEGSILGVYRSRVANFELPSGELWLDAAQAKAMGFVDEIAGQADMHLDAAQKLMFVNGLFFNMAACATMPTIKPPEPKGNAFDKILMDQLTSGAQNVSGSANITEKQMRINLLMKYAGGK